MPPKKSRTTSIATQRDLSATAELPEDTPAWGKSTSMFFLLNTSINSLDEKINKLNIKLEQSIKTALEKTEPSSSGC